jgi:hypothetical protein
MLGMPDRQRCGKRVFEIPIRNLTWDYLLLGDGLTVMLLFDKDRGEVAPPEG